MAIDPSQFCLFNVADTCAVWNVLSSLLLYRTARSAGCSFCCTSFVRYECLFKPRTKPSVEDDELKSRFRAECDNETIRTCEIEIADLQSVAMLANRRRLSKGELSSIAFALRTKQAFLTDDQKARKLATEFLDYRMVQTTPHLFGWLYFTNQLIDTDKDSIIPEHERLKRPLTQFFEEMYVEALRCRLMAIRHVEEESGAN